MELLKACDDFLFYFFFLLFEDELADSGHTSYSVKIRIMPTCIFILATSSCRIDFVWKADVKFGTFMNLVVSAWLRTFAIMSKNNLLTKQKFQMKIIL